MQRASVICAGSHWFQSGMSEHRSAWPRSFAGLAHAVQILWLVSMNIYIYTSQSNFIDLQVRDRKLLSQNIYNSFRYEHR